MTAMTLVLGNQLFPKKYYNCLPKKVFMAEDQELCTHFKYHKHKIIHFLASMRNYRDELQESGYTLKYWPIEKKPSFFKNLMKYCQSENITEIHHYEIEDHFFERKLSKFCNDHKIERVEYSSPMFICPRSEFQSYLKQTKKPHLNKFYQIWRLKTQVLIQKNNQPIGGKWHFDHQNRKKIPKSFKVEKFLPQTIKDDHVTDVKKIVQQYFSNHPGSVENFWIPISRKSALKWFRDYLVNRFECFGDFQDALDDRAPFLYHSILSPLMNIGFLTPGEVINKVESLKNKDNLNSVEGFIRQVLGWREFVRGIYQNFDERQQQENFFNHHNKFSEVWYSGDSGIAPLDQAIQKSIEYGYCHHIERLMVLGNFMLLTKIDPKEVYRWFMEMFVDSSDWVMGPNVFGMSQFSDGGIFATKPYFCGSNYYFKMGHFSKKSWWKDGVDGLYWRFIDEKREFLKKNHRLSMMVSMVDKMDAKRKKEIFQAADEIEKILIHQR